jgi:hypothetical protein
MMPPTQLEAIAQAVAQRQSRYQRDTLLFGLLARLLLHANSLSCSGHSRLPRAFLPAHPGALLLSLQEAAFVGRMVAATRFKAKEKESVERTRPSSFVQ